MIRFATLVAITGLIAFQLMTGHAADGLAELTVIPLNFYMLGRRSRGCEHTVVFALVFAYWLAADAVTAYAGWRFRRRSAGERDSVWRSAVRREAYTHYSQHVDT